MGQFDAFEDAPVSMLVEHDPEEATPPCPRCGGVGLVIVRDRYEQQDFVPCPRCRRGECA